MPEGQVYHAAGPTEGGILIAAVWDSKESADRFMSETLLPAMQVEAGFAGQPEERVAELIKPADGLRRLIHQYVGELPSQSTQSADRPARGRSSHAKASGDSGDPF